MMEIPLPSISLASTFFESRVFMRSNQPIRTAAAGIAAIGMSLVAVFGCGRGAPKTYPVKGFVQHADGKIEDLAGSHVEAASTSDPTVRASGVIQKDGSFKLEM